MYVSERMVDRKLHSLIIPVSPIFHLYIFFLPKKFMVFVL